MTDLSPDAVRALILRTRKREIGATESAKEVRRELLSCIEDNRQPILSAAVLQDAKRAAPYGAYPSHRTLMMIFEHEL